MADGYGMTLTGSVSGAVANIIEGSPPGWTANTYDTTTHSTSNGLGTLAKSKVSRLEPSTFTIAVEKAQATTFHALRSTETAETWTIVAPDFGTWACSGVVTAFAVQAIPMEDRITAQITIAWTGAETFTAA